MKCSQVNQQVLCGFDFTNNAKEDYYILKRDTPLDGLDSPYLTISQGNDVMEYAGIIAFMAAPTKDDLAFIKAGETVTTSINLTSSYKFTRDGIYTVEYTRPLVYISSQEMSMMSNEDFLQASHYEDLVVSTEVEVMDSHNLEPTLAEIESAEWASSSSEHETVYINDRCSHINFGIRHNGPFPPGVKCVIREMHKKLCNTKFLPLKTGPTYTKWFGRFSRTNAASIKRRNKVYQVLNKIHDGITQSNSFSYSNGGYFCNGHPNALAYASLPSESTVCILFVCPLFFKISDFACDTSRKSKFHTIIHELSHKFGSTIDVVHNRVTQYGIANARSLADNHPNKAIKNAENYAFFIQDLSHNKN
jgi:hypothetical protein